MLPQSLAASVRADLDLDVVPFDYQVAARVTGPFQQDVSIAVTGPKGSGKSMFSIYLAWCVSKHIAQMNKKDPEQWGDYFDIDTHLATVDREGTRKLMGAIRGTKNNVFILDDVSISWGSRTFMTRENRMLNDIFTIMRTYQAVLILNMVDQAHVDIVPRTMCDYFVEMYRTYYTEGFSLVKVYKQERNTRMGTTYSKFLTNNGKRVTAWVSLLPPSGLQEKYKEMRRVKTDALIDKMVSQKEEEDKPKPPKPPKVKSAVRNRDRVIELWKEGAPPTDIATHLNLSMTTVYSIIRKEQRNG